MENVTQQAISYPSQPQSKPSLPEYGTFNDVPSSVPTKEVGLTVDEPPPKTEEESTVAIKEEPKPVSEAELQRETMVIEKSSGNDSGSGSGGAEVSVQSTVESKAESVAESQIEPQKVLSSSGRPSRAAAAKAIANISSNCRDLNDRNLSHNSDGSFGGVRSVPTTPVGPPGVQPRNDAFVALPTPYTAGPMHNLFVSTVLVNHKLAKLKAELLNILYIHPENLLRWSNANPNHFGGGRSLSNTDDFLAVVQEAATAADLMKCVLYLESILPERAVSCCRAGKLPDLNPQCDKAGGISTAAVAVRLYALDRNIRYENIQLDLRENSSRKYRTRVHFVPKCMLSANCVKPWCHIGRCGVPIPSAKSSGTHSVWSGTNEAGEVFSRYEPIPNIGVDPAKILVPLMYPPSQQGSTISTVIGGANGVAIAGNNMMQQQRLNNMYGAGYGSTGLNRGDVVPGSNYFANLALRNKLLQEQHRKKKRGFIADSEEEDEDEGESSDESLDELDSDDSDAEDALPQKITRFDVDHDDLVPFTPRYEDVSNAAWV